MTIHDNMLRDDDGESREVTMPFKASTVLSFLVALCMLLIGGLAYWQYDSQKIAAQYRSDDMRVQGLQDQRIRVIETQINPLCEDVKAIRADQAKQLGRTSQVLQYLKIRPVD